jgi:hypothetical protein
LELVTGESIPVVEFLKLKKPEHSWMSLPLQNNSSHHQWLNHITTIKLVLLARIRVYRTTQPKIILNMLIIHHQQIQEHQ